MRTRKGTTSLEQSERLVLAAHSLALLVGSHHSKSLALDLLSSM
jgi:hypothetical protein